MRIRLIMANYIYKKPILFECTGFVCLFVFFLGGGGMGEGRIFPVAVRLLLKQNLEKVSENRFVDVKCTVFALFN